MSGGMRRGGIPGPESRTGLVRPAMTEAEFERRQAEPGAAQAGVGTPPTAEPAEPPRRPSPRPAPRPRRRRGPARPGQAGQAPAGPADVRHRRGPGQEALALRHPRRQGPLRGRQRPAPPPGRLDGPLRLPRPPRRPRRRPAADESPMARTRSDSGRGRRPPVAEGHDRGRSTARRDGEPTRRSSTRDS